MSQATLAALAQWLQHYAVHIGVVCFLALLAACIWLPNDDDPSEMD